MQSGRELPIKIEDPLFLGRGLDDRIFVQRLAQEQENR